jgi:hypothetical protein
MNKILGLLSKISSISFYLILFILFITSETAIYILNNELDIHEFKEELKLVPNPKVVCFIPYQGNSFVSNMLIIKDLNRIKFDPILGEMIDTKTGIKIPIVYCRILTNINSQ